jgi:RNA polymerase sigma-70 factor (ECF subfamily)
VEKREQLDSIIAGCIKNDRVSQEKLFKLFYGKLMVVCTRYTGDKDSAQEILQEGFIKIFDKIATFESNGSFEGWMRRIVTNTALDFIRKHKKNMWVEETEVNTKEDYIDPYEESSFEESFQLKAEFALEAIQQLSPAYKTVFNLYVMEEYSHKEIAELLGISEGTSKSNLAKAKINLQKIIEKKYSKITNE